MLPFYVRIRRTSTLHTEQSLFLAYLKDNKIGWAEVYGV
ncbi:hypothetical protein SAMN04487928_1309 [Butyrivibrio proteoclasticus]|uniref:Uncharacterized protein n=1 Tax=Butyrivibrio proteoclasticus TaxID=43305 RepID=A0A1I5XAZ6_9FIRM|nr:hypothetical protein SAMN04487928_1309 [Butyrivibrio proteoclasticus]